VTATKEIRVAIVGVGNCANSLVQGVHYYKDAPADQEIPGLMNVVVGGYHVRDVKFVAAFDVDSKKVGIDLTEAIWASENNTIKFADVPKSGVTYFEERPTTVSVAITERPLQNLALRQSMSFKRLRMQKLMFSSAICRSAQKPPRNSMHNVPSMLDAHLLTLFQCSSLPPLSGPISSLKQAYPSLVMTLSHKLAQQLLTAC